MKSGIISASRRRIWIDSATDEFVLGLISFASSLSPSSRQLFPVALTTMSDNSSNTPEIRVGDRERNAAMERLGNHFADGYLDVDEFSKRAESAAAAKTQAELQTLFADLPAEASPASSHGTPANPQHQSVDQELQTLMKKGRHLNIVDSAAGVLVCVTIVLMVSTNIDNAWLGFIAAAAVALIGRAALNINNDEEKLLNEINEEESKRRTERLRLAAQKRREIQEGQQ